MAIVYEKNAGLGRAISDTGSILGNVIAQKSQERARQSQFSNINKKIAGKEFTPTLLQEILAQPGGEQYLQQYAPIIAPILKEQARSQGANQYLAQNFPNQFGSPPPTSMAPQISPIEEADLMQKGGNLPSSNARVSPGQEQRSLQSNVADISGVPSRPPIADSNRVGPKEQTNFQQGGQSGMGLNPPQEAGGLVRQQLGQIAQAQPNATPANAPPQTGIGGLSDEDLVKLAGSPYKQHQDLAKAEMERRKPGKKEEAEIRKESRAEIAKYSEPFKDLHSIDSSVAKLEKAKDLIQNRKVSLDENQFRRLATAILEDEDYSAVAQYFKTDEQKMLFALLKDYFKTKDIGGSNPSTKEVLLSLATLPSENMGKDANLSLINQLLLDAKGRQIKGQKINEIRRSGNQYNFGEFQNLVESSVKEGLIPIQKQLSTDESVSSYIKQIGNSKPREGYVFVIDSQGNRGQIPKSNIKSFKNSGGTVINERSIK